MINFLAIAIYTRLLVPEDYGRYVLVIAGVGFFDAVSFWQLRLSILSFMPAYEKDYRPLLPTVLAVLMVITLLTGLLRL